MHSSNVQPIKSLHLVMNLNDHLDDESLDTMDVNQTIADLVQSIRQYQSSGGDLNVINEYRNYFTEEEFDLLTDLLTNQHSKKEENRTTFHGINLNLTSLASDSTANKLATSESQRKEQLLNQLYYTDYDENRSSAMRTIATFNSSSPIYLNTLNNRGQASLKEYYFNKANNNNRPEGKLKLI